MLVVVPPQLSMVANKLLVIDTLLSQLSAAVAVNNQAAIAAVLPDPAHSSVNVAGHVITGSVQSSTTTLKLQVATAPLAAVNV